ncbi:MAG TPA: ribosome-associated translation inhibitor RaiA [Bryobacteraceae bacterium]|jgi:putative sigma-54 modulation protein|nr:ribosome-associated translation inhibitor RaiA [Bryobacteraceae bacterium]
MKVSYRGMQELPPKMQEKLDAKFAKVSKLLERRGEKEAHVVITTERHLHKAEITVQFYDHQLVGVGSDADLLTAMTEALDKLEKQAVKTRAKWRDKRREEEPEGVEEEEPEKGVTGSSEEVRIFRVNHHERRKPMTLEEALLEFDGGNRNYLVYRDAERECVSVLVRRRDGNFDLIES